VDAFGYQSVTDVTDDAVKWAVTGPFAGEWQKEPTRPLIVFAPCENGVATQSRKRFSADHVRHAVYWGFLMAPPAGVSYSGQGVVDWDLSFGPGAEGTKATGLPMWRKSLFMPAAKQMSALHGSHGATYGPVRPQSLNLCSLLGGQIGARIQARQNRIERDVVLQVVEQPCVLDFQACGCSRPMQQIIILHPVQIFSGPCRIPHGYIQAGNALHKLDVRFQFLAHRGGNQGDFADRLGVAVGGLQAGDQTLPRVDAIRMRAPASRATSNKLSVPCTAVRMVRTGLRW